VRAYDVVTMLQRDGHPTALGEAIAMYGRIFKSQHILSHIDTDETCRRDIKGIRNLQEGRHALARKICHGEKGELHHRYERLENQLGALGLVLNWVVLWTTVYLDGAVRQLRAQGYPVCEEEMARLSPFVSSHLGVHGTYSFVLPDLAPGAIRELRAPTSATRTTSDQLQQSPTRKFRGLSSRLAQKHSVSGRCSIRPVTSASGPFSARTAGLPATVRRSGGPDGRCRAQFVEDGEEFVDPLADNVSQMPGKTLPVFGVWYLSWRQG
jgi:hypothetical protein